MTSALYVAAARWLAAQPHEVLWEQPPEEVAFRLVEALEAKGLEAPVEAVLPMVKRQQYRMDQQVVVAFKQAEARSLVEELRAFFQGRHWVPRNELLTFLEEAGLDPSLEALNTALKTLGFTAVRKRISHKEAA